jgi:hypothetical protein
MYDDTDLITKSMMGLTPQQRHERRMSWFVGEAYRQAGNRAIMARCERYYDQHQTPDDRRREVEARGQTVVQYDQITPQIDWLIGTERRMRVDEKVMPRRVLDKSTQADAENKTQLLKWIDDTNRTVYHRSAAWDDMVKAGMGWLEVFATQDEDGWTVAKRSVPWKFCLWDSLGLEKTGIESMRFFFRMKAVDLDLAIAHFPDKAEKLKACSTVGTDMAAMRSWMGVPGQMLNLEALYGQTDDENTERMMAPQGVFNVRERVLLVECWSLEPFAGPNGFSVDDPVRLRPLVSVMTEYDTLAECWSPYQHGKIPFVPYWGYMDKTTGLPYSPIKRLLDRQDALNKAMSRALHDISTDQTHMEASAVDDEAMTLEELKDELDDPAGVAVFAKDALSMNRVRIVKNTASAEAHIQFADRLERSMQASALVNKESIGQGSANTSGAAIGRREDQSSLTTAELFDSGLLARQLEGELTLSVVEQYMGGPLVIPSKNAKGEPIAVPLNQPMPDGSVSNDITAIKARYVITEQPWRASLGQAQFESLMLVLKDLAGPAPQVVMALLDVAFEYADIPNKQQIVERIRSVTGQKDPAAPITPEQQAMQAQQKQLAQAQFQHQLGMLQADLKQAAAKAAKAEAESGTAQTKSLQLEADTWVKRLEALGLAATVAMQAAANPALTPVTDSIAASVGMTDLHPQVQPLTLPANIPQTAPVMAPQPLAMMTPPRPAQTPYPGAPA